MEVMENPEELTDDLVDWLCSSEAHQGHVFFWQLGMLDRDRRWLATVEQVGTHDGGVASFGAYLDGFAVHDRTFVEHRLDELAEGRLVTDRVLFEATGRLGGSREGIRRIEKLIVEGRLTPALIGRALPGRWTETIASDECLELLRLLAGPGLEGAMSAVHVASFWERMAKPLEGDLADFVWRCLEAAESNSDPDDYELDRLAAALARRDHEKGFRLLEALMEQADEAGWEPFHDYRDNQFWGALRDIDREWAIRLMISSAVGQQRRIIGVPQLLQGVPDQEADHDLLLALAEEGERQAETVANSITAATAGFWPLAVKLLATYPDNEDIQDGVALGAERIRGGIISYWGSSADESEAVSSEVE